MLIALIIVIGLIPAAVSLMVGRQCAREEALPNQQFQQNFLLATDQVAMERIRRLSTRTRHPDEHYVDGMGLVIGDITCKLNARSPYIRCAANPTGPCQDCREYEGKEYD